MLRGSMLCSAKSFSAALTARSDAHSLGAAMWRAPMPVFSKMVSISQLG
jgi:hypothetical protein